MVETNALCNKKKSVWYLYILECSDSTYYTGITNNLKRRLEQHNNGTGAKYTRGRAPLKVVYTEICANRSEATKLETKIKKLSRKAKEQLITNITHSNTFKDKY